MLQKTAAFDVLKLRRIAHGNREGGGDKETREQATKSDKQAPATISVLPPSSDSPTEEKMS